MKQVEVYTDGACSGNPGPGGWGAILEWQGHEKELSGGAAAGGAYHPALGELVRSRIMRAAAEALLAEENIAPGSAVTLGVNGSKLSQMIGQHRRNIDYLTARFQLKSLKIRPLALSDGEIAVISVEKDEKV